MKNRIVSLVLAILVLFALAVNASASDMPELDKKGSLTFAMDVDGVSLDSGFLNLYYVATLTQAEEDRYDFRLVQALADAGAKLDTQDLYDGQQAERLLEKAQKVLPEYQSAFILDGKASFEGLDAGLYLVWQREQDASDGYAPIRPFLISVPRWQEGAYAMDVEADPKVPFESEPTEPTVPPPPPPPNLPQTGQLNWPVPVMAVAGVVLLILGWCLCLREKRLEHEE